MKICDYAYSTAICYITKSSSTAENSLDPNFIALTQEYEWFNEQYQKYLEGEGNKALAYMDVPDGMLAIGWSINDLTLESAIETAKEYCGYMDFMKEPALLSILKNELNLFLYHKNNSLFFPMFS